MKVVVSSLSSFAFGLALTASATAAISVPSCANASTLQEATLNNVRTASLNIHGNPFGMVYATRQKDIAFFTIDRNVTVSTLNVLNTSSFPPTLIHQYSLEPAAYVNGEGALGVALSNDGRYLFLAAGPGALIVDTARAANGLPAAIVGTLNGTTATQKPGTDAIEVTISKDNKYAFVSQEYGYDEYGKVGPPTRGNINVFKLHYHHNGTITGTPVGFVELGYLVVGTALSPNGRLLYATSESYVHTGSGQGFLSVLDVKTLETNPSEAVLATNITAGCSPVRIIVSRDGRTVWTTSRASNYLLGFDAAALLSAPNNALRASVEVGTWPVGLTFARDGSRIITADSNRMYFPNTTTGLTVVDVEAALKGDLAVLGRIPTGLFPREFAVSPDGKSVLVADHDSQQIQAVDVTTLP